MTNEIREKIIEYNEWLEEEGGTDSDVYDWCKHNHISVKEFYRVVAEKELEDTKCVTCKYVISNLGSLYYPCNVCCENPKFSNHYKEN